MRQSILIATLAEGDLVMLQLEAIDGEIQRYEWQSIVQLVSGHAGMKRRFCAGLSVGLKNVPPLNCFVSSLLKDCV